MKNKVDNQNLSFINFCLKNVYFPFFAAHINHIRDVAGIDYVGEYYDDSDKSRKKNENKKSFLIMKWMLLTKRNKLLISKISHSISRLGLGAGFDGINM